MRPCTLVFGFPTLRFEGEEKTDSEIETKQLCKNHRSHVCAHSTSLKTFYCSFSCSWFWFMAVLHFLDARERVTRLPHSFSSLAGNLNDDWWGRLHYDKILSNKSMWLAFLYHGLVYLLVGHLCLQFNYVFLLYLF